MFFEWRGYLVFDRSRGSALRYQAQSDCGEMKEGQPSRLITVYKTIKTSKQVSAHGHGRLHREGIHAEAIGSCSHLFSRDSIYLKTRWHTSVYISEGILNTHIYITHTQITRKMQWVLNRTQALKAKPDIYLETWGQGTSDGNLNSLLAFIVA